MAGTSIIAKFCLLLCLLHTTKMRKPGLYLWNVYRTQSKILGKGKRHFINQDKGSDKAVEKPLPGSKHFFWSHHRKQNVFKKADTPTGKLFSKAINAWTISNLNEMEKKISRKWKLYFDKIQHENEYWDKRKHLFGRCTSQSAGSIMKHKQRKYKISVHGNLFRICKTYWRSAMKVFMEQNVFQIRLMCMNYCQEWTKKLRTLTESNE